MNVVWSVPVFSRRLASGRGDLVRARALIRELRSRGHEVRVVEAANRPGRQADDFVYRKISGRLLPSRARLALRDVAWWWRSHGHGRRVADVARERGADVIVETQVHGVVSGAVAVRSLRSPGIPLVLDDVSPPAEVRHLGAGLPALVGAAFERQRAAASLLVAPSPRVRDRLRTPTRGSARVTVIPNGVDLEAHAKARRSAGRRLRAPGDPVVLGFAGSFQPWHEVSLLVEAVADLAPTPPVRLLLIGDGPGREPALARSRALGLGSRIDAPGAVPPDAIPDRLAACDVGVLPGTNDYGHPMKLLEYAAAGLPIVAPDLPPVRELVPADGMGGLLFTAGDRTSLSRALARLVAAPRLRRRLGAEARRELAREAGWSVRGRRLARLLGRATAGPDTKAHAVGSREPR